MTTVAQMIEWMNSLPQDAVVECGEEVTKGYDTYMKMVPVDIAACDVFDYTSPADREKYPAMAGKTLVMIKGR
jgi:hypothetical protein